MRPFLLCLGREEPIPKHKRKKKAVWPHWTSLGLRYVTICKHVMETIIASRQRLSTRTVWKAQEKKMVRTKRIKHSLNFNKKNFF